MRAYSTASGAVMFVPDTVERKAEKTASAEAAPNKISEKSRLSMKQSLSYGMMAPKFDAEETSELVREARS